MFSRGRGTVPIYINNRDWLTWPRAMARYFDDVPGTQVVIVDNASTYPPLLDWYAADCPYPVVRLDDNMGPHAPWTSGAILPPHVHLAYFGTPYYVLTDPDLDLQGCPKDLIPRLIEGYERYPEVTKTGPSLEIDDLPNDSLTAAAVIPWERQFWARRRDAQFFDAPIDTTFALYDIRVPCRGICLRSDRPYVARHMPWYLTRTNLSDEHVHYIANATAGSWSGMLQHLLKSDAESTDALLGGASCKSGA
jgi:hypothetical protein